MKVANEIAKREEIWSQIPIEGLIDPFALAKGVITGSVFSSRGTRAVLVINEPNYIKYRIDIDPNCGYPKHWHQKNVRELLSVITGVLSDQHILSVDVPAGKTYEYEGLKQHSPWNNGNERLSVIAEFFREIEK